MREPQQHETVLTTSVSQFDFFLRGLHIVIEWPFLDELQVGDIVKVAPKTPNGNTQHNRITKAEIIAVGQPFLRLANQNTHYVVHKL